LGVERFIYEIGLLPDRVQDDVMSSLLVQAKKYGFSYVFPTRVGLWTTLKQDPEFYKKYVTLGGTKPEDEFNYHLAIFFELTQEAYTGDGIDRRLAYFWWQQHIKSAREAEIFFRAVDDTHAYT
jgi:hypothetical protein